MDAFVRVTFEISLIPQLGQTMTSIMNNFVSKVSLKFMEIKLITGF